ncbi:MAG: hypothetical protein A2W82_07055 [Sulfurimonas sp. RIFCSPLOWO2_12_36_12]|uniref:hypothetical protein n=1 Tax=Sulfurimonas sp. RIFCSPLOWO2_12_36_12 TaxID=1802253 RepID=UPI0008D85F5D|nr:hypothetical protein [Sulfurimonas sp. RIFCSPLOWO2_12_36_12]OHE00542.1 MAG: hypothetical protein A2W82_07055 [Sulfurimonas sp. RIFCSPLOWO2_12_36_12]
MKKEYRNIYIVDSKSLWDEIEKMYDLTKDLVLTYDFGLKKYITDLGGKAEYIDHLVDQETLEKNNYIIYQFFNDWHYDKDHNDIFKYKNVPFGFSFRLEFWNDYIFYVRLYLSMLFIQNIKVEKLYVSTSNDLIIDILNKLNMQFHHYGKENIEDDESYYFPISKWIDSKIRPSGLRGFLYKTREMATYIFGNVMPILDRLFGKPYKHTVFIQEYHPTRKLLQTLREDSTLKVVLVNFSRYSKKSQNLKERLIPISGSIAKYEQDAMLLMEKFRNEKYHRLILSDGSDVSNEVYNIIENRLVGRVANNLRTLDSCINYLNKNKVDLVVLIANIGHTVTLFDLACKSKNIPSLMIINGILAKNYQDEAKYATYINAYSQSIKDNYFSGMDNIVTLGDPRMDTYNASKIKNINREIPTITIGASGFNSTDLNSYVAVEFDFMYDVLSSFNQLKSSGEKFKLIIKIRPNGYKTQYQTFVNDFFRNLDIEVLSVEPMAEVLQKTDFYISIYSQTLFEASCLGIPVIYYKKDTEITNAPFDNDSELVTILSTDDMVQAFYDFKNNHPRYEAFLDKKIMEQYIGALDGNSLQRNIDFIYKLLEK